MPRTRSSGSPMLSKFLYTVTFRDVSNSIFASSSYTDNSSAHRTVSYSRR